MEILGLHPLSEQDQNFDVALYFRSGRAAIPARRLAEVEVAWGVFTSPEVDRFAAVMPGLGAVEKAGTFIQCDGVTQSFEAVIQAHGACASVKKILDGMRLKANAPILAAREVNRDSV
jgi:hypothetical protein